MTAALLAGLLAVSTPPPDTDEQAVLAALSAFHAGLEAGDTTKVLAVLGPSFFIAEERGGAGGGDRIGAHLFRTGERLQTWPKAFLEQGGPYRNTFEAVSVSIRGDAAVAITRDSGRNAVRSWSGEESEWMLGRIDGSWRLVGWTIRDVQLPGQTPEVPEAQVRERVARFGEAFRAADAPTLEAMLATEFSHINSNGSKPTREEWLAFVETRRRDLDEGRFRWDVYRNVDLQVGIHGDTAVVTGVNESSGVRGGEPFSQRLRFTQVWIREDGQWRRTAFHDTRIPKP